MSQSAENQPVLSRSAKILIIGFSQYFIMGCLMAGLATSTMEMIENSESPDFSNMTFVSSNFDLVLYGLMGSIFFFTGSITLIVSGIVYSIDKKKGIKFAVPKNEPVNIKRQTIYAVIPLLDAYAAFKVKKFWIYFLIMVGVGAAMIPLDEFEIFPQTFPENVLIQEVILIPIAIVIIRIFSRKWNERFDESKPTSTMFEDK